MLVEEQIDFSLQVKENGMQGIPNPPRKPTTILSHFYSIQKAFELCYKSGKDYDVVIKSRFDLGRINRNTKPKQITMDINELKLELIQRILNIQDESILEGIIKIIKSHENK